MFCRNCGSEVNDAAVACLKCGADPKKGKRYCAACGVEVNENQVVCLKCGSQISAAPTNGFGKDLGGFSNFKRCAEGKLIAGVCTGIGKMWNVSPWLIRVAFVFLPFWLIWLIVYIILAGKPIE